MKENEMNYLSSDGLVHAHSLRSEYKRLGGSGEIRSNSKADFRETCKLRTDLDLPCRDCKYFNTNYCKDKENRNGNLECE